MSKPSTKLGDAIGRAVRGLAFTFDYVVPVAGLATYRMIPGTARGAMFGGPSTSAACMSAMLTQRGNGWSILRAGVSNHPDRPSLP